MRQIEASAEPDEGAAEMDPLEIAGQPGIAFFRVPPLRCGHNVEPDNRAENREFADERPRDFRGRNDRIALVVALQHRPCGREHRVGNVPFRLIGLHSVPEVTAEFKTVNQVLAVVKADLEIVPLDPVAFFLQQRIRVTEHQPGLDRRGKLPIDAEEETGTRNPVGSAVFVAEHVERLVERINPEVVPGHAVARHLGDVALVEVQAVQGRPGDVPLSDHHAVRDHVRREVLDRLTGSVGIQTANSLENAAVNLPGFVVFHDPVQRVAERAHIPRSAGDIAEAVLPVHEYQ